MRQRSAGSSRLRRDRHAVGPQHQHPPSRVRSGSRRSRSRASLSSSSDASWRVQTHDTLDHREGARRRTCGSHPTWRNWGRFRASTTPGASLCAHSPFSHDSGGRGEATFPDVWWRRWARTIIRARMRKPCRGCARCSAVYAAVRRSGDWFSPLVSLIRFLCMGDDDSHVFQLIEHRDLRAGPDRRAPACPSASVNKSDVEKDLTHGGATEGLQWGSRFLQCRGCTGNGLWRRRGLSRDFVAESGVNRPLLDVSSERFGERPQFGRQ